MVLLVVIVVVGIFFDTLLLNAVIWVVSSLALIELYRATGILRWRGLTALGIMQAFVIPFANTQFMAMIALPVLFLIALSYFALLVKNFGPMSLGICSKAFFLGLTVPLFFSCAVFIRDQYAIELAGFYLLVALGAAWISDTGAYFVGTFFGKRKLAPKVSPKKTIEGTIGGIVISTGLILLLGILFEFLLGMFGRPVNIDIVMLGIFLPFFSLIGMLGDLSASAIKREYGIKDFGAVMPGHGGVMDRFDSVLFTLPAVYLAAVHIGIITHM